MQLTSDYSFDFLVRLEPGLDSHSASQAVEDLKARWREIPQQKGLEYVTFAVHTVDESPVYERTHKFQLNVDHRCLTP